MCSSSTRRRPRTTSGAASPGCSGSTRTPSTSRSRSRTPRWAWPRRRRCGGSTCGWRASAGPSTRASTSAPFWPMSASFPEGGQVLARTGPGRRLPAAGAVVGFLPAGEQLRRVRAARASARPRRARASPAPGFGHRSRGGRGRCRVGRDHAGGRAGAAEGPAQAGPGKAQPVRRPSPPRVAAPARRSPPTHVLRGSLPTPEHGADRAGVVGAWWPSPACAAPGRRGIPAWGPGVPRRSAR